MRRATCVVPSPPRMEIQDGSVASSSIRVAPITAGSETAVAFSDSVFGGAGAATAGAVVATAVVFAAACAGSAWLAAARAGGAVSSAFPAGPPGLATGSAAEVTALLPAGLGELLGHSSMASSTSETPSATEIAVGERHQLVSGRSAKGSPVETAVAHTGIAGVGAVLGSVSFAAGS